jgi:hypothetical protein
MPFLAAARANSSAKMPIVSAVGDLQARPAAEAQHHLGKTTGAAYPHRPPIWCERARQRSSGDHGPPDLAAPARLPTPASLRRCSARDIRRRSEDCRRQQRVAHHRHRPPAHRPEEQGLRRSPTRRRAFQARRHSRPEALPRQRGLHAHHAAAKRNQRHANRRLTNRRASEVLNTLLRAIGEPCFAMVWLVPWAGEGTLSTTPGPRAS